MINQWIWDTMGFPWDTHGIPWWYPIFQTHPDLWIVVNSISVCTCEFTVQICTDISTGNKRNLEFARGILTLTVTVSPSPVIRISTWKLRPQICGSNQFVHQKDDGPTILCTSICPKRTPIYLFLFEDMTFMHLPPYSSRHVTTDMSWHVTADLSQ